MWQQILPVPEHSPAPQTPSAGPQRQHAPAAQDLRSDPQLAKRLAEYWGIVDAELVIWQYGVSLVRSNDRSLTLQLESGATEIRSSKSGLFMYRLRCMWHQGSTSLMAAPQEFTEPVRQPVATEQEHPAELPLVAEIPAGAWTDDEVARELWAQVLEALRDKIPRPNFNTYLADTVGHSLTGDTLTIVTPSQFIAQELERRLLATISRELERQRGSPVKLRIAVASSTSSTLDNRDVAGIPVGSHETDVRRVSGQKASGDQ